MIADLLLPLITVGLAELGEDSAIGPTSGLKNKESQGTVRWSYDGFSSC